MAWGGAGGPPARAHPVFGRFLKKKLYSFGQEGHSETLETKYIFQPKINDTYPSDLNIGSRRLRKLRETSLMQRKGTPSARNGYLCCRSSASKIYPRRNNETLDPATGSRELLKKSHLTQEEEEDTYITWHLSRLHFFGHVSFPRE
jgi:hypothetical protein